MIWALSLTIINFITNNLFAILKFLLFDVIQKLVKLPPLFLYYSTLKNYIITLYFNRYRGKPAIAKFD